MNAPSLQRLIRHAYADGTHSYHYAPVAPDRDDAVFFNDRADSLTDWPPQPLTAWLNQSPASASGTNLPLCE